MHKLPTNAEIKGCSKACVVFKETLQEYCLAGKPISAEAILPTSEINITTEEGFYSFNLKDLTSVQFLK